MSNILAIDNMQDGIGVILKTVLHRQYQDNVTVVTSAKTAFEQIAQTTPDLVFICWYWVPANLDIFSLKQPGMMIDSVDLYQQLRERCPDLNFPIVIMSAKSPQKYEPIVKKAGLSGHVRLPAAAQDMLDARNAVLAGNRYFLPN